MIRKLPREVVERIAAGEVIERPAAVVKELIENALDAGATNISIELEGGGKRAIRVRDDGSGMNRDDLLLAFEPHATSKLGAVDDLLAIASYGFRGEALASVGAVSRARIVTRTRDAEEALEIHCDGGALEEPRPAGAPVGTLVEALNLFYNVPARQRFLKGEAAEGARCLEVVARFAMVADGVGFKVTLDGKSGFELPPRATPRERAAILLGEDSARGLVTAKGTAHGITVEALLGTPDDARSSSQHQYSYLNGRLVKDSTLRAAMAQAYREFLAPSLQPAYVLRVTMDPSEVDVNVHPAKSEVRFRDSSAVFRAIHHVVLETLRNADLAARPEKGVWGSSAAARAANATTPADESRSVAPEAAPFARMGAPLREATLPGFDAPRPAPLAGDRVADSAAPSSAGAAHSGARESAVPTVPPRTRRGVLRVFETYVVYESGSDLVLVDQHALHERILYERMRRALESDSLAGQRLVAPIVIEIGRAATLVAEQRVAEFAKLGIDLGVVSPTAVGVHSVPPLLKRADLKGLVEGLLGCDDPTGKAALRPLEERLHSMACRAAVKAGDPLNDSEIEALLVEAERLPEAKACPHGRPTVVRVPRGDLERWFRRSGF
jgi:DNA mismatch repair protein MutL